MFGHPLPLKGGIEIRRKLHGGSNTERCRRGVYGRNGETPVSGPEKVDILQARQPNLIARIYRRMRGRHRSLVSLVFFSGTSVYSLDSTCDPRSLLTPSIRILLPLAYFLAKELARNATAMCVIHVWHTCQWCFVIPVLDVRQACHQLIKHLCCMVTKVMYCNICMAIINSTLLKDENRYSTESCILMNV